MNKLLSFERIVLFAVSASLSDSDQRLFDEQLRLVNKVQRLLDWNEIELYCTRWFKVRWPQEVLFENKEQFALGTGLLSAGNQTAIVTVWSVDGHVFSIESKVPLKRFQSSESVSFTLNPIASVS